MGRICCLLAVFAAVTGELSAARVITLEEAYDRTLASDQSIGIAYFAIRKANLEPWSALTRLGPQLNGGSSYGTRQSTSRSRDQPVQNNGSDTAELSLGFQQPLFDLTAIPAYKIGKLSAQAARLQYQFIIRQVLFSVTTTYYEVLKQERVVAVSRATVDLASQQLDLAQKRADVGEVTRVDVLRAQVTVESNRQLLIVAQNTLASNRNLLGNILNIGGDGDFQLVEPPDYPSTVPGFEELVARAYAKREDLKVDAITIEQDVQRRSLVVASYGPRIVAQSNGNTNTVSSNASSRTNSWDASIAVQLPFLTGGQREIDLIGARYTIQQSRLNYEQNAKTVQQNVKDAWLQVRTLESLLKASRTQVAAAEQSYKDIDNQYRAGAATSLDVLDALNTLNTSRKDLAVQTYDYQVALRNLEQTSGVFQEERVKKISFR